MVAFGLPAALWAGSQTDEIADPTFIKLLHRIRVLGPGFESSHPQRQLELHETVCHFIMPDAV
jgi:hypothetical protein